MSADLKPNQTEPSGPDAEAGTGLTDPRTIHPGPDLDTPVIVEPDATPAPSRESPEDRGGPELIDPAPIRALAGRPQALNPFARSISGITENGSWIRV